MPWPHCGNDGIPDDQECPKCGLSKAEWTLQVDKTRQFELSARKTKRKQADAWIAIRLQDGSEQPVADQPFRVELATGRVKQGTTDAQGEARVEKLPPGLCRVSFPGFVFAEEAGAGDGPIELREGSEGKTGLERETNALHEFQIAAAWEAFWEGEEDDRSPGEAWPSLPPRPQPAEAEPPETEFEVFWEAEEAVVVAEEQR